MLLGERLAISQSIGVAVVITALLLASDTPKKLFAKKI